MLVQSLDLLVCQLLSDFQQHVSVGFLQGAAGFRNLIDLLKDLLFVRVTLSRQVFQGRFLLLEGAIEAQESSSIHFENVVHPSFLRSAQTNLLPKLAIVPPAAGGPQLQAAAHRALRAVARCSGWRRMWAARLGRLPAAGRRSMVPAHISGGRRATLLSLRGLFGRDQCPRTDGQRTDKEREYRLVPLTVIQGVGLNRFSLPP